MIRIMKSIVMLSLLIGSYAYATTYTYTGNNFTVVNGVYTTSMKVTGSFTTSAPIPPNEVNFDINGILTSWSFFDGLQTLNNLNSGFLPLRPPLISTDASGKIAGTDLLIWSSPIATSLGELQSFIFTGPLGSHGLRNAPCNGLEFGYDLCNAVDATDADQGYSIDGPGVWERIERRLPIAAPTMPQWSLILLTLLLGAVGIAGMRRQG